MKYTFLYSRFILIEPGFRPWSLLSDTDGELCHFLVLVQFLVIDCSYFTTPGFFGGDISLLRGQVKHWKQLPRELVSAPSLSVLKSHLENDLNNML